MKSYYTIGEIAAELEVSVSLLRLWANEFDFLVNPKRNGKQNRLFSQKDTENLRLIYHLIKVEKYSLKGAKEKLQHNPTHKTTELEVIQKLEKIKSFLMDLKQNLT